MIWHFQLSLVSKQLLPLERRGYLATVEHWSTNGHINSNLSCLLQNASTSVSIVNADASKDELRNMGEPGLGLLNGSEPDEIHHTTYCHNPTSASDHLLAVTLGFSAEMLETLIRDLDRAFFENHKLQLTASGDFSIADPNPHSRQPTQENFEIGLPLQLHNIGLKIGLA